MTHAEMMATLEEMVDRIGLTETLATLGLICHEKADHIRHNWQDKEAAKPWRRMGQSIDAVARKAQDLNI